MLPSQAFVLQSPYLDVTKHYKLRFNFFSSLGMLEVDYQAFQLFVLHASLCHLPQMPACAKQLLRLSATAKAVLSA